MVWFGRTLTQYIITVIISTEGDDSFQRFDRFKRIVHSSAETILGVTGKKMRSFRHSKSSSFIQLSCQGGAARLLRQACPGEAMRCVWDALWCQHPASVLRDADEALGFSEPELDERLAETALTALRPHHRPSGCS